VGKLSKVGSGNKWGCHVLMRLHISLQACLLRVIVGRVIRCLRSTHPGLEDSICIALGMPWRIVRPSWVLFQLLLNLFQIVRIVNLDDPVHLGRIPHQLFRAGVQHLDFVVAGDGEVVQHDVGHR